MPEVTEMLRITEKGRAPLEFEDGQDMDYFYHLCPKPYGAEYTLEYGGLTWANKVRSIGELRDTVDTLIRASDPDTLEVVRQRIGELDSEIALSQTWLPEPADDFELIPLYEERDRWAFELRCLTNVLEGRRVWAV